MAQTEQLGLPFLTAEEVAAVDGARQAIEQFHANAVAQRRWSEADELYRLGEQLLRLLDNHATRVRARR